MARWLLSTALVVKHLRFGADRSVVGSWKLKDMAVSMVSFAWILADVEASSLEPAARVKWRSNIVRFREQLHTCGGEVPALSHAAIEKWGRLQLLELKHKFHSQHEPVEMWVEERFVVATAAVGGFIYATEPRDWNERIAAELGVPVEVV